MSTEYDGGYVNGFLGTDQITLAPDHTFKDIAVDTKFVVAYQMEGLA